MITCIKVPSPPNSTLRVCFEKQMANAWTFLCWKSILIVLTGIGWVKYANAYLYLKERTGIKHRKTQIGIQAVMTVTGKVRFTNWTLNTPCFHFGRGTIWWAIRESRVWIQDIKVNLNETGRGQWLAHHGVQWRALVNSNKPFGCVKDAVFWVA